ncbi:hypothetical protein DITRI_Ditri01bG0106800 [Diplodiscus trichospermus]
MRDEHGRKKGQTGKRFREGYEGYKQCTKESGNRSYKEVLMGPPTHSTDEGVKITTILKEHFEAYKSIEKQNGEIMADTEVNFEVSIPIADMKWIESCVFGRLNDNFEFKMINVELEKAGFKCQVCRLGGLSVVLKFESMEGRDSFLVDDMELKDNFFKVIQPWTDGSIRREYVVEVELEEMPLQLWHENFFSSLGNRRGSFVRLDECTKNRSRFDLARILILVDSRFRIPPFVTVRFKGQTFKILVTMDGFNDQEMEDMDIKEMGSLNDKEKLSEEGTMNRHIICSGEAKVMKKAESWKAGEESLTMHESDFDPSARVDYGNGIRNLIKEAVSIAEAPNINWLMTTCKKQVENQSVGPVVEEPNDENGTLKAVGLNRTKFSQSPVTDEDIERRNAIRLKEVKATWDTSVELGLIFEGSKELVISKFKELEIEDIRKRKG